jgi:hypothetical protein
MRRVAVGAALSFAVGGGDVQPPVITLDLEATQPTKPGVPGCGKRVVQLAHGHLGTVGLATFSAAVTECATNCSSPEYALHESEEGSGEYCHTASGLCVKNRQGRICNVLTSTAADCPVPKAKAFDHHDGEVSHTKTTVLFIESRRRSQPSQVFQVVENVSYTLRAEFIIYFDATDRAGNQAEQVPFSMLMNDYVPPVIHAPFDAPDAGMDHLTLHSCDARNTPGAPARDRRTWISPAGARAEDAYDGVIENFPLTVKPPSGCSMASRFFHAHDQLEIDTQCLGDYVFSYTAADFASIFGHGGTDNVACKDVVVTVTDVCKPVIVCDTKGKEWTIGGGNFNGSAGYLEQADLSDVEGNKFEHCADLCHEQRWKRVNSCSPAEDACAYFEMIPNSHICKLYHAAAAGQFKPNLVRQTFWQGKLKDPCHPKHTSFRQCKEPYVDPGAFCVDSRDSMTVDGGVSGSALAPSVRMDPRLALADGPPIGVYEVSYTCVDEAGNSQVAVRRVQAVDRHQPVLDVKGNMEVTLLYGDPANSAKVVSPTPVLAVPTARTAPTPRTTVSSPPSE